MLLILVMVGLGSAGSAAWGEVTVLLQRRAAASRPSRRAGLLGLLGCDDIAFSQLTGILGAHPTEDLGVTRFTIHRSQQLQREMKAD